jgi:hypothetical protein
MVSRRVPYLVAETVSSRDVQMVYTKVAWMDSEMVEMMVDKMVGNMEKSKGFL